MNKTVTMLRLNNVSFHVQDCSMHTASCVTFSCVLRNMSTAATLTLRARVWNSTLLEVKIVIFV